MTGTSVTAAREQLLVAALRVLAAEHTDPHAHSDAESEYADELLALAARDLYEATEASDRKPVGWDRTEVPVVATGDWVTVILRKVRLFDDVWDEYGKGERQPMTLIGHDAIPGTVPLALTSDVTVILTDSSERVAKGGE